MLSLESQQSFQSFKSFHSRLQSNDDVKRSGVCQYFKENLSLKVTDNSLFHIALFFEITLQNQESYVAVTHQSPSQSITGFDEFLSHFDKLLNHIKLFKPSFAVILGDFNARSKCWWPEDVTSHEGTHIESLATMHGLQQLISDQLACLSIHHHVY